MNTERLQLTAAWDGEHVRVRGYVAGGAGNTLNLSLSQAGDFVYDEIFRGAQPSVIALASDSVDVTSIAYEPSAAEAEAFGRTGATALDVASPLCLDALLYQGGEVDLLAVQHVPVSGTASQRSGEPLP